MGEVRDCSGVPGSIGGPFFVQGSHLELREWLIMRTGSEMVYREHGSWAGCEKQGKWEDGEYL